MQERGTAACQRGGDLLYLALLAQPGELAAAYAAAVVALTKMIAAFIELIEARPRRGLGRWPGRISG